MRLASAWARLTACFRRIPSLDMAAPDDLGTPGDFAAMPWAGELQPLFILDQLKTLLTWASTCPRELDVTVTSGPEGFSEAALFRHDEQPARYLMYPTGHGTVVLVQLLPPGTRRELPTIEAALAQVRTLEGWITGEATRTAACLS